MANLPGHMPLRPLEPGEKVNNPDGSYSTERTVTVQSPDGSWVNVPSLWMGPNGPVDLRPMGDDYIGRVAQTFEKQAGKRFVRFNDLKVAEAAAAMRSEAGGAGASTDRFEPTVRQSIERAMGR